MTIWTELPRLAVGSHRAGAHRGCLMNVISWANGDSTITDMPACTHPLLAKATQVVNDTICTHRDGDYLCPECSSVMYGYEPLLVGTTPPADETEAKRLAVALAVSLRPFMPPLTAPAEWDVCAEAFDAAQAWLDCPCDQHVIDAYAAAIACDAYAAAAHAAYAAYASYAASAAHAAYASASAAAAAIACDANAASAAYAAYASASCVASAGAAYAAYVAYAAANAASPLPVLDTLIDTYYARTGRDRPSPNVERVRAACEMAGMS